MDPAALSAAIRTESAVDFFSSCRCSTSLPVTYVEGLDALLYGTDAALRRGDVVEVQGLPSSGKTSLLLHLAATALLMRKAHVRIDGSVAEVRVGGKEETVVWMDCTTRFDIARLASLVRHHLVVAIQRFRRPRGLGAPTVEELDSLVEECLARFHVFHPTSTLQLAATVQGLPEWFKDHATEDLGYVLVDGMSEFAWADQYVRETTPKPPPPNPPLPPLRLLLAAIANLRKTLAPVIFITQWVFRPSVTLPHLSQEKFPFYQHHFAPPHWPSISSPSPSIDPSDPLKPPTLPNSDWPTFPIKLHITMHPPAKAVFRKGVGLATVLSESMKESGEREGKGTEGIKCVLRGPGGKEIGSWEMGVHDHEIVT
ncbi:hypothetical protein JCM1840_007619 [Sporobolomyces johnsonii]